MYLYKMPAPFWLKINGEIAEKNISLTGSIFIFTGAPKYMRTFLAF